MQHNAQATCSICKSIPALLLLMRTPCGASVPRVCRHLGSRATLGCPARSRPVWPPLRRLPQSFSAAAQANRARDRVTHPHTASFTLWIDRHQPTEPRWLAPSPLRDAHHAIVREPARVAALAAGLTSDITVRGSLGASDFRINHEIRALDIPLQYM
jgi:hypothetical protein